MLPAGPAGAPLAVAVAISRALNVAELQGADAGLAEITLALAGAEALGDPGLRVRAHSQHAFIAIRAGRYDLALAAFASAEQLIAHANVNDQFAILLNAGTLRMFEGDLAGARPALVEAARLARAAGMPDGEFKATHNLGYLEFLAGDLPAALAVMDRAGRIDSPVSRGIWLLDRARVLLEAGLTAEADRSLAAAADIFRRDRLAQDLAETELERARVALVAGDVAGARRLSMRARDRFRRRGNDRWRRSAELVVLQGDLAAGRPPTRLTGPAHRLQVELDALGFRAAARSAALLAAEAHLAAGEVDLAASALAAAGRRARAEPITAQLHEQYVRALLDAARGRSNAAARRARTALGTLAAYQAGFGSIDLASAAAVHGRRLAALDLAFALRSGNPEAVLDAAEHGRAVSARLPAVRPPADPDQAALLAELRQTVETLRGVEHDPGAAAPLERRRAELEATITAQGWVHTGAGEVRRVVPLPELAAALGACTLVEFLRSDGRLHAVTVTPAGARLTTLGSAASVDEQATRVRADLDVLAQPRLPGALRGAVTASLRRSLAALDAALLGPLPVTGPLVLGATGLLGQLPWGLLPSTRGVPVLVAPSASAWHAAHTAARSRQRRVVAVAGPGLRRGADEAADIAAIWRGRAVPNATPRQVQTALGAARILHVAAHGLHQTQSPLFSSIRLHGGPLFAHELDRTVRTPEHVVLSACELGRATVRPGEEALGLTSVLLRLGTRCVVAGVARVGDDTAASTLADYHRRLRAGTDAAAALAGCVDAAAAAGEFMPFACFGAVF